MAAIGDVLRYLRGCYEADNREASIFNLKSERVQHLEFLSKGGDFVRGLLDVVPVDRSNGIAAQKAAELYRTERSLVFGSVLLTGRVEAPSGRGKAEVFAPLIYFPARVEDKGDYAVLHVDTKQQRINTRLLQAMCGGAGERLDELLGNIPGAPFSATAVYDLISVLEEIAPGIDVSHLRGFGNPEAVLREAPARAGGNSEENFAAWWGHVLALIPNSPETRGVLTEMAEVAGAQRHSAPVRVVFGGEPGGSGKIRRRRYTLPAQLSAAQEKAVWSAGCNPLTVLHGPPGTGKSYTSAVLALDHVARGQSVLIAARTDQALDVIMEKLQGLLGNTGFVLRGGRHGQFAELKERLDATLANPQERRIAATDRDWWRIELSASVLRASERNFSSRIAHEHAWAECDPGRFWGRLRRRYLKWRMSQEKLAAELLLEFHNNAAAQQRDIARFLQERIQAKIASAARRNWHELRAFRKALGARTTKKQKEYLEGVSLKTLFGTFPLWMTTIADVHDLIPMEVEQFDLAIIDEATQCDMASCGPILQRAKRVVVTGDPKQLRHVSFLSRERQRNISERVSGSDALADELDFRGRSLLDLVLEHLETDRQLVFLDEHFRSRPELIAFSNERFYDGKLKVMRVSPEERDCGLEFRRVKGKRDNKGVNRAEAEGVCAAVGELMEAERGLAKASSIGVLSPLRDQVEFLERKLIKEFSLAEIQRHQLRVGTAYSFQGDERDVMFLSLAVDDDSHASAFAYLQRADVFNVSITRARERQVVFHSIDARARGADDLLRAYLEQGIAKAGAGTELVASGLQEEIQRALSAAGYECRSNVAVGGVHVDLLAGRHGKWIGLDVICDPSPNGALTLEEYRLLERAGLKVFPISEREWRSDPEWCLSRLAELCGEE